MWSAAVNSSRPISLSIVIAIVACALPCAASDRSAPLARPDAKTLGSLSCASASCHGRLSEGPAALSPRRQEYHRWLEHDPHAQAARTVRGEKFANILTALGGDDADLRTQVYARCAACHDPQGLAAAAQDAVAANPMTAQGIGCESCHGPAEHWLARHYERDISREQLRQLGMVDTKSVSARAAACAGCHVGDGERDLNHDMLAAGHPPLRFEMSAYHDRIAHKHWTDAERIETPHFKARLWEAGQVAGAEAALALLESRATRAIADKPLTPWPEFSEYDCFACHQRLRPIKAATSGRGSSAVPLRAAVPGIPGWQPWNLALAEHLLEPGTLDALRQHLSQSLVTDPAVVQRLAAQARLATGEHPAISSILGTDGLSGHLLAALIEQQISPEQSWAASSQQLLALQAAYLAARDEVRSARPSVRLVSASRDKRFPAAFDSHDEQLQGRIASLTAALRFGSTEFQWPAYDWQGLPTMQAPPKLSDQQAIVQELKLLANELQEPLGAIAPAP